MSKGEPSPANVDAALIAHVGRGRPDAGSSDRRAWAERMIGPREFPRLDEDAIAALRALLTFTWR